MYKLFNNFLFNGKKNKKLKCTDSKVYKKDFVIPSIEKLDYYATIIQYGWLSSPLYKIIKLRQCNNLIIKYKYSIYLLLNKLPTDERDNNLIDYYHSIHNIDSLRKNYF